MNKWAWKKVFVLAFLYLMPHRYLLLMKVPEILTPYNNVPDLKYSLVSIKKLDLNDIFIQHDLRDNKDYKN